MTVEGVTATLYFEGSKQMKEETVPSRRKTDGKWYPQGPVFPSFGTDITNGTSQRQIQRCRELLLDRKTHCGLIATLLCQNRQSKRIEDGRPEMGDTNRLENVLPSHLEVKQWSTSLFSFTGPVEMAVFVISKIKFNCIDQ